MHLRNGRKVTISSNDGLCSIPLITEDGIRKYLLQPFKLKELGEQHAKVQNRSDYFSAILLIHKSLAIADFFLIKTERAPIKKQKSFQITPADVH